MCAVFLLTRKSKHAPYIDHYLLGPQHSIICTIYRVYCLACAADRPDAIKRIYDIKSRPAEKPLSLWLGLIEDIKNVSPEGKGWGPKLFAFMEAIWPGSVSLVVSRGNWLQRMGVGDAADLIGTPDSIALRVPNSTLTVALLKETGPLAITSANPSGECTSLLHY